MAIDKDLKSRVKMLLEYNIKKGVELQEADEDPEVNTNDTNQIPTSSPSSNIDNIFNDKVSSDNSSDEIPGPNNSNTNDTNSVETPNDLANPTGQESDDNLNNQEEGEDENNEITIISNILKRHSEKLDNINKYVEEFDSKINTLKQVTEKQDQELFNQAQKIKKLTPLTPLESLENIIKLTPGAKSVQDYWNEKLKENGQDDEKVAVSDENGIRVKIKDLPRYSEKEIQDSLFESTQNLLNNLKNY